MPTVLFLSAVCVSYPDPCPDLIRYTSDTLTATHLEELVVRHS